MGGSKKERLELLEAQVERLNGLNDHAEAARQTTAEEVALEMGSLSADLTSVSDTAQLAVARIVARIETLERREPYGRDALCEAQAAVQIAVAGSGSVDYGNESGHFRACPARYGMYAESAIERGEAAGPCKFNCEKDPTGVAEETTTRVDPTQNPPDSKVERMGTLMAKGSVGFDTNPDEHIDPEGPREDPEQDRDAARDELAAFSGLQAKRVKAPPILPPLNEILAQSLKQIPRMPRLIPTSGVGLWSEDICRCGASESDECICCPTCLTPTGSGFGRNCFDESGCGVNRDNEVRSLHIDVKGPPIDTQALTSASVREHSQGLLHYVGEMLMLEARDSNGGAFLFWGRLWCALLAVRDLSSGSPDSRDEDNLRDFMEVALYGDLGEIAERYCG